MEENEKNEKQKIKLGAWILIVLSIFSSLSRTDYNLIGAIAILIITIYYYDNFKKLILKIIIHLYALLCFFDILWLLIMLFVWTHGNNSNKFWKSLSFMHNLIYWFGLLECLYKVYLMFRLKEIFKKNEGNIKDLYDFTTYSAK